MQPRKAQPQDQQVTVTGSRLDQFWDFFGLNTGPGLSRATTTQRGWSLFTPTPRKATPPPDDDEPSPGENDPTLFPPFPPDVDVGSPGTSEPPEDTSGEDDEVLVSASRPSVTPEAMFPFAGAVPAPVQPSKPRRPPRRRRTPPPKRPVRTRPAPSRPPRIPIPVPEIAVIARRLPVAGLLSLVPPYLDLLGDIDRYGTEHMYTRLFPPLPERKRERKPANPQRSRGSDPNLDRNPQPLGEPEVADLPTLVVEGSRPGAFPSPSPVRGPSLVPVDVGYFAPIDTPAGFPSPHRAPRRKPRLTPRVFIDAPSPVGSPNVLQQPFTAPSPRPVSTPAPAPSPAPSPRPRPSPSPSPSPVGAPTLGPSPGPVATPVPGAPGQLPLETRCSCRTVNPNKKPKRKTERKHLDHPPELEVEYKTKFGRVKVEGEAKKYCVKAPGARRICYTPEEGLKLSKPRAPSVTSILKKLLKRRK